MVEQPLGERISLSNDRSKYLKRGFGGAEGGRTPDLRIANATLLFLLTD
jgi:hypothetical protein